MEISIILNVLQNYSNQLIKVKLKNFRTESLQGNHLPVLFISVLFVSKVRTRRSMSCSLQSVDVVQRHITGNAYPGTSKLNFSVTSIDSNMKLCFETIGHLVNNDGWFPRSIFRTITFEKDRDRNIMQRAWDGLLPNRILIYCM